MLGRQTFFKSARLLSLKSLKPSCRSARLFSGGFIHSFVHIFLLLSYFCLQLFMVGGGDPEGPTSVPTPGAAPYTVPTIFNQGVGKAYEEAIEEQQGFNRFNRGALVGPYGTIDNPTYILSDNAYRIVGCVGTRYDAYFFLISCRFINICFFVTFFYLRVFCPILLCFFLLCSL
jgi:hypothetical protein